MNIVIGTGRDDNWRWWAVLYVGDNRYTSRFIWRQNMSRWDWFPRKCYPEEHDLPSTRTEIPIWSNT